jgi:hypothetical protein
METVETRSRKGDAFRAPTPSIRTQDVSNVNWRRTQLTRDLIRCDLCGNQADTVHFVTEGGYPRGEGADAEVEAVFACAAHDAGPYCTGRRETLDLGRPSGS